MERDARESANRAKRLQGEVEMMRSEYEVVSEEASGLRGSLAGAEVRLRLDWGYRFRTFFIFCWIYLHMHASDCCTKHDFFGLVLRRSLRDARFLLSMGYALRKWYTFLAALGSH